MAAAVLETLTIPRASSTSLAAAPIAAASSFPARQCSVVGFSQFKGLKMIHPTRSSVSLSSGSKSVRRGGGRIICEAQDTAVIAVLPLSEGQWKPLVLDCDIPVLVEFWAPWCGPCRMIQVAIDELATQYAGKLKFYKVNTDECPGIASQYGIRSIPTVMIFKGGEKRDTIIGAVPKTTLTTSLEKFL